MPIHCPKCGHAYDVVSFEGGKRLQCKCGFWLDMSLVETVEDFVRYFENEEEKERALKIQREAQEICQMILDERAQNVDIEIRIQNLEEEVTRLFPDKINIYKMIYEARFNRLWEQFRRSEEE